jgi:hypothetical protein
MLKATMILGYAWLQRKTSRRRVRVCITALLHVTSGKEAFDIECDGEHQHS